MTTQAARISGRNEFRQPFERISGRYRFVNRIISFGLDRSWRRHAIANLKLSAGMKLLDVGSGQGEMTEEIEGSIVKISLDPTAPMLRRQSSVSQRIKSAAEAIPLKTASIDCFVSAFVLRNLTDRTGSFREIRRVVGDTGRGAILELSPPQGFIGFWARLFIRFGVPLVGGILTADFPAYRYLSRTVLAFPAPEQIAGELRQAGFTDISYRWLAGPSVLYTIGRLDV